MFGRGNRPGKETSAGNYDADAAIWMLATMFNQFPLGDVTIAHKNAGGDFKAAMDILLEKQASTGKRPKEVHRPKIPRRMLNFTSSEPVKTETIFFRALDDTFDFYQIAHWEIFNKTNDEHLRLLKGTEDPISFDDLLEVCVSGGTVVQLPCSTKRMRCNFTRESIEKSFMARPECPVCKTQYPVPGTQPTGTMHITVDDKNHCEGFRGDGSIVITFEFSHGLQGTNHPHPGRGYAGTTRVAYLPQIEEGKKALKLLKEAFQRGQLFTIGQSLTTGANDQVTYGSIHLKTSRSGGQVSHGWPDPTYFSRMRNECAGKMIFDDTMKNEVKALKKGRKGII